MKKLIAVFISLTVVLCMTACSSSEESVDYQEEYTEYTVEDLTSDICKYSFVDASQIADGYLEIDEYEMSSPIQGLLVRDWKIEIEETGYASNAAIIKATEEYDSGYFLEYDYIAIFIDELGDLTLEYEPGQELCGFFVTEPADYGNDYDGTIDNIWVFERLKWPDEETMDHEDGLTAVVRDLYEDPQIDELMDSIEGDYKLSPLY